MQSCQSELNRLQKKKKTADVTEKGASRAVVTHKLQACLQPG